MQLKLFRLRIVFCQKLEPADIAAMAEFSLSITADNVIRFDFGQPVSSLSVVALFSDGSNYKDISLSRGQVTRYPILNIEL